MINYKKCESSDNTFYYNPNIEEKNYPYIEYLSKFDVNSNFNDDFKTPKTKNTDLEPSEIKYNKVLFKMKKKAVMSSNNSSNNNGKNSIDLINDSTDELKDKIKTMRIKENDNAIDISSYIHPKQKIKNHSFEKQKSHINSLGFLVKTARNMVISKYSELIIFDIKNKIIVKNLMKKLKIKKLNIPNNNNNNNNNSSIVVIVIVVIVVIVIIMIVKILSYQMLILKEI